ncbi:MAG TPA: GNAT family N-acetyltransferase [Chloroflexota bacterium]|nr:GNAT family N-acetyltransferase [Chloroflexota bacterium]
MNGWDMLAAWKGGSGSRLLMGDPDTPEGRLIPITHREVEDPAVIQDLARWRNAARTSFFHQAETTPERTRAWLDRAILTPPDCILFLMISADGRRVGHVGLRGLRDGRAELHSVLRAEPAPPGFATSACRTLIAWTRAELRVSTIHLSVFADNGPAVALYQRLGLREVERVWYARREQDGSAIYEAGPAVTGQGAWVAVMMLEDA